MAANVDRYSLSSEGSLVCHTYSPRTRDTHTYCRAFDSGAVTTCFNYLGLSRLGFEHPTFRLWYERSNPLRPTAVALTLKITLFPTSEGYNTLFRMVFQT